MKPDATGQRIEWPTVAVAAAIAAGFAAIVGFHARIPAPVEGLALAGLAAWYNSLRHEVIHGHPTPWPRLNHALAAVPIDLVTPFATYAVTHLAHHRCRRRLTDPTVDPESFLVTPARWEATGPVGRAGLWALQTVPGRLVLSPWVNLARGWRHHRVLHGPASVAVAGWHLVGAGAVLTVVAASGMSVPLYLVSVVWMGGALSSLRSFAEHRPVDAGSRSAVVRAGPVLSLLYLNNNLHHTHHARPGAPWFALPGLAAELGSDGAARAGAGWYPGYRSVVGRYWRHPLGSPVYRREPSPAGYSDPAGAPGGLVG